MKAILTLLFGFFTCWVSGQVKEAKDDNRTIKIPVIFHVISSENSPHIDSWVSTELIRKEIKDLNDNYSASNDMSNLHTEFKVKVGNPNIEFYLADFKGSDNVNGIIRVKTVRKYGTDNQIDTNKYLNIYISDDNNSTSMSPYHNVRINYKDLGAGGQTVTHELGHYFGLWHVWGASNCRKIKLFSNRNDFIEDTPEQKNCTDLSRAKPCPDILNNTNINFNNFMDYSACRCMFTEKQAIEIRNNIIKYRPEIFSNSLGS